MAETIARGEIQIDLNDEATLAGLRRIETQFERTMHKIDHEHATAQIDATLAPLEDKVANAKRRLRQLEAQKTELPIHANTKELDLAIVAARRNLKRLDGERATVEIRVKGQEKVLKAEEAIQKATLKRIEAIEKREVQTNRLADQREKNRLAQVRLSSRVQSSLWKQRERELNAAHTAAAKINADMDRERAALPRLQREYVETARKLEQYAVARRKAFGDQRAKQVIDFKISEAEAKMRGLKATLERIGGPIDLDVDIHPGRAIGQRLRAAFKSSGVVGAAHLAGMDAGDAFARGMKRRLSPAALGGVASRAVSKVGDVLGSLSSATVRLGPFTATIRQLGLVMAVLGPTILDVVGALGSLVSVVGAGIAGAATVGAGAVTGLGLSFLGLKFSTRNTGQEIKNLRTYINAVQKAQEKYGPTAGKTVKAQRELNHAMAQVSPLARETALGIERFYTNWDKRTQATQKNLGQFAQQGFHALDQIAPMWASRTNQLSGILQKGFAGAFKFLGAGQGKGILDSIMGDFNASLPAVLHGLGSVGHAFLNLGKIGASFLPQLGRGFDTFTGKILAFTQSDRFPRVVQGWVTSMRNLGRLLATTGRFLMSFFSPGVAAGNRFVTTMTNAISRWDAFNRSVEGRSKLADFFQQSVSGAQQLYAVIAPIASVFVQWAANLSPFVTGVLRGVSAVTNLVTGLIKVVGLTGGLRTLGVTLGALYAVGKISAATRAVIGFTKALLGMKAAQTAVAVGGAAGGAGGIVPVGAGRAGAARGAAAEAERLAAGTGKAARAGGILKGVLGGIAGVLGFTNPLIGAAILGVGGLAIAYSILHKRAGQSKRDFEESRQVAGRAGDAYRAGTAPLSDLASAHKRASIAVREARRELAAAKPGTDAYATAVLNLKDAQRQAQLSTEDWTKARSDQQRAADIQAGAEQKHLDQFDKINKSQIESLKTQAKSMPFAWERIRAEKELAALEAQRAPLVDRVNAALNRQASVSANTARAAQGMLPVLGQAEQKLGALARLSKSSAVKVALKFEAPKDVSKVAASATKTLKSGTPARIVTKIVADSSSAEQAVRRLQAVRLTPKKLAILESGGAAAIRVLSQIAGRRLTTKEQRIAESGGSGVIRLLNKILGTHFGTKTQVMTEKGAGQVTAAMARIIGIRIPPKTATVTANTGGAYAAIRAVGAAIDSLHDKTVTVRTQTIGRSNKAEGRKPSPAEVALTGEGGGPEIIANQKTGTMSIVREPTLMSLSKDDYVIPTEPKYRQRGRDYFAQFAKAQGIPGFRGGKKPKLPKLIGAKAADANNLKEVKGYRDIQQEEENKGKEIVIAERRVKEPDTLVKVVGTDAAGNPMYAPDQSKINEYAGQLGKVRSLQEQLVGPAGGFGGIMKRLRDAGAAAIAALNKYRDDRKKNLASLNHALSHDRKLSGSKDKDTAAAAKKRVTQEKSDIDKQKAMYDSSISVTKDIDDDQTDANISRIPGYQLDLQSTVDDITALGAKAADEATKANPTPAGPSAPSPGVGEPGGPTVAEDRVGRLETEKALAQAGLGMNGAVARPMKDIIGDLLGAEGARLAEGQAMLNDATTSNDQEAYGIIQQAAGAISSLTEELNNLPDSAAGMIQQTTTLGNAMRDLYKSFSNNFAPVVGNLGSFVSNGAAAGAAMSSGSAGAATVGGGPAVATTGGRGDITINQTFPTQPDPMTWAAATLYELQAAL